MTRAAISRMILDLGRPVIIAGDVNPPPKMLEKLAAGLSARLFYPEENMSRFEKLKIAEKYSKAISPNKKLWGNRHERDALAAALRAWKRMRHVIAKLDEAVAGMDENKAGAVMECVLLNGRPVEECRRRFG